MTKQILPKPDLDSHSDEQLQRLYLAIANVVIDALTKLGGTSRGPSVKDLASVSGALASARSGGGRWVDAGGLNRALEVLVALLSGQEDLEEVVKATFPTVAADDPRVTALTATYLNNGEGKSISEAFNEAQHFIEEYFES